MTNELPPEQKPLRNHEAETALLSCLLHDPNVLAEMGEQISPEIFYEDAHQKIAAIILSLYERHKPIDLVSVGVAVVERKQVEDIGGLPVLAKLWSAQATGFNAGYYLKIVRDRWLQRRLCHVTTEILREAYEAGDVEHMIERAEQAIMSLATIGTQGTARPLSDFVNESFTRLDEPMDDSKPVGVTGIPTGFRDLDQILSGLHDSELIIVAGRPSSGKTAFAGNLLSSVAMRGERSFFASLEQPGRELMDRLLCGLASVDATVLRQRTLSQTDVERLYHAGELLREATLWIDDAPGQSVRRIAGNARRLHARTPLRMVAVDYLQRVAAADRRLPRHEQIGEITGSLKELARELKCPVVLLCQINRESENRPDAKPRLSDLKGSGDIEQDADVVLILHRPRGSVYVEVEIAKQRNGPTGEIILRYEPSYLRFTDCDATERKNPHV